MILQTHIAALTDIGRVRHSNEDRFAYDEASGLGIVCDGMGGMAAGEIASSIAAETCLREFALRSAATPLELRLALAIRAANAAVFAASQHPDRRGMGTTLVAAVADGAHLLVANVGDSRAYLLRGTGCRQISNDHSYLAELQRTDDLRGANLSPEDRERYGSILTRAVGAAEEVEAEFFNLALQPEDRVLLVTDGLTRHLQTTDIRRLATGAPEAACQQLIHAANDAGGMDNITCLLLDFNN